MTEFYSTICNNHNQIIYNLQQMKKYSKDEELRKLINESLEIVRFCKKQGQRMENRLKQYKEAIENLGFKRNVV